MMRFRHIVANTILLAFLAGHVPFAYAQNVRVLGEVKTNGKVLIESSNGQWLPSGTSYPLLQNTGIKVEDGSAALFVKDGSRIDINRDSLAIVDGEASGITVNLGKGSIAFNIPQTSTLTVVTPGATITANVNTSIIQKVSIEKTERILGVISVSDKGTEVRSISGRITAVSSGAAPKIIASGESVMLASGQDARIYKTQALAQAGSTSSSSDDRRTGGAYWQDGLTAGIGALGVLGFGIGVGSWVTKDGDRKLASPSGF